MVSISNTHDKSFESLAYFIDQKPKKANFLAEVKAGLSQSPKAISPKFFYDERGSHLFNKICETPEYYLTRTEVQLLNQFGNELANLVGPARNVIEFGCGSSIKIETLLRVLDKPAKYLAIDISRESLLQTAKKVAIDFPSIKVGALCADFLNKFEMPEQVGGSAGGPLVFFPGSTIGNLTPNDAGKFLKWLRNLIGVNGSILLGVDLKKEKIILNEAYNDTQGFTAAFNLNLLHRMKNELNAEIDIASFRHLAFFNEEKSRIEMHLISERSQTIVLEGSAFPIKREETIHTENSYKYSLEDFAHLASNNGYLILKSWTDKRNLFSIQYLVPV